MSSLFFLFFFFATSRKCWAKLWLCAPNRYQYFFLITENLINYSINPCNLRWTVNYSSRWISFFSLTANCRYRGQLNWKYFPRVWNGLSTYEFKLINNRCWNECERNVQHGNKKTFKKAILRKVNFCQYTIRKAKKFCSLSVVSTSCTEQKNKKKTQYLLHRLRLL